MSRPRQSVATTNPAPTGGLNALNPISNMPETDAIVMRNFFPEPFGCRVRKGYKEHATGLTGAVASLMRYNAIDGISHLFAVDQVGIFDVTAPGDYSAATPLKPSTNPWWQYTNSANPAGTWLIAFNGVETPWAISNSSTSSTDIQSYSLSALVYDASATIQYQIQVKSTAAGNIVLSNAAMVCENVPVNTN
jgi:hypothetical protein